MKTKPFNSTLTARMLVTCMLALPLAFSGCDKNDDTPANDSATLQEATTVMTQAVDPVSGGLVLQTEFSANYALGTNSAIFCGLRKDSTIAGQFNGTNRSFNYSLSWSRLLNCSGGTPSVYSHTFTGSGSYSVPAMSSTGNITGSFTVSGLGAGTNQLSVDQTYTYTGTQQSKVGQMRSIISNVTINSTGVIINKTTRQIVSGTATITATGTISTGETFNYTGTLTFLGNRQATLAISGGSTTTIQW